jgi:hypothetical protein
MSLLFYLNSSNCNNYTIRISLCKVYHIAVGFGEEDHGGLDIHYGVDIGEIHFGMTTTYLDPEGNHFELVELNYDFRKTN